MRSTALAGILALAAGLALPSVAGAQVYPYDPVPAPGVVAPAYPYAYDADDDDDFDDDDDMVTGSVAPVPPAEFPLAAPHEIIYMNGVPCRTVYIPGQQRRVIIGCAR